MMMPVKVDVLDRVFYTLAKAASPQEILAIHSTPEENERLEELAQKNGEGILSMQETLEVNQ